MDKISSYPLRFLEADPRAESYWARAPIHWRGPVNGANENPLGLSYWARLHNHWASPSDWRHSQCWAGHMAQLAVLEQFQNCTDFRITAPFSQNEIARFFQRPVISKITYLIN